AMAAVPGFPKAPFLILAAGIGLIGYSLWSSDRTKLERGGTSGGISSAADTSIDTSVKGHKAITGGGVDSYALTLPVVLECGKGLSGLIGKAQKEKGQRFVDQMIPRMRQALYADLGVRFPGVHVRTESPLLDKDEYSI